VNGTRHSGRLFPAPSGGRRGPLWAYSDFRRQCWAPLMMRAGLGRTEKDRKGVPRPVVDFGPHTLRHVYASIQIANGVTPKRLQKLLGHASLAMTMDLYGHLWTDPEGDQALAEAAERAVQKKL
jgi:integrase